MNKTWIRRLKPEDVDTVAALNTLAFGGAEEAAIVRRLHADHDSLLSLVAHRHDEMVGHIEFFRILIGGKPSAVGLGPMSVLPELHGRGIGSSLVRMGLLVMAGRGESIVFVLGHPEFYPKFGFSAELAKPFKAPWSGPAFMANAINPGAPVEGELTYPAAFG
ncbi:N-acetyltransferase [uncultured Hyphomonas sp.]|uniref:GNAT family N-acetyltransferase n=1 Tax=uncultured Hyphomonas sp. TaxID=225298 RepID=UPI002AAB5644|nr:N-acetyltransferase [uncultured Hyphomonas sp.]